MPTRVPVTLLTQYRLVRIVVAADASRFPNLDKRARFRIQRRNTPAGDLQDPEHRWSNARRHTGTYQRTSWPTRRCYVLIFSHGSLNGVLLQALREGTVWVDSHKGVRLVKCMNASITVIEIDSASANGELVRYSDTSHLIGPMVEENVDVQDAPPGV